MSTTTTTFRPNATALRSLSNSSFSPSTLDALDHIEAATRRHNPAATEEEIIDIVTAAANHQFGVDDEIEVVSPGEKITKPLDLYNARLQAEDHARMGRSSTIWVNDQPYLSYEVDEVTGRVEVEAFND